MRTFHPPRGINREDKPPLLCPTVVQYNGSRHFALEGKLSVTRVNPERKMRILILEGFKEALFRRLCREEPVFNPLPHPRVFSCYPPRGKLEGHPFQRFFHIGGGGVKLLRAQSAQRVEEVHLDYHPAPLLPIDHLVEPPIHKNSLTRPEPKLCREHAHSPLQPACPARPTASATAAAHRWPALMICSVYAP